MGVPLKINNGETDLSKLSNYSQFTKNGFDTRVLRPYINKKGQPIINLGKGQVYKVANASLPREAWLEVDERIIKIGEEKLFGIQDLMRAGLEQDTENGLGTTIYEWQRSTDTQPANISMGIDTLGQEDGLEYDWTGVPIPIISKQFRLDSRKQAAASRIVGDNSDNAMRKVMEMLESILFNGAAIQQGGYTLYGYTNLPVANGRMTGALTANWALSSTTGKQIRDDVLRMRQQAINANKFGGYMLYIPLTYDYKMREYYDSDASDKMTIAQSIMSIADDDAQFGQIMGIRPTPYLTGNNVLLVQMTTDSVEAIWGQRPDTVNWQELGGAVNIYRVISAFAPLIKFTEEAAGKRSGIVHYSV